MDELARSIVKWVSLRERSVHDVRERLRDLTPSRDQIDSAIESLKEAGFLSERRFIRAFIRDQVRKRKGAQAISAHLKQRHRISVSAVEIQRIVQDEGLDFMPEAVQLLRRRTRQSSGDLTREKALRFLRARGYSANEALAAIDMFEKESSGDE